MTSSQAFIPAMIQARRWNGLRVIATTASGVLLLSLLAQISIPLSWTPVPITGQTFGVMLISLLWGRRLAFGIVSSYLVLAVSGLPVLSGFKALTVLGPTSGYLAGMLLASQVVGFLSDRGASRTLAAAFSACMLGSAITFICGLSILAFFTPSNKSLLVAGLLPFLPGDFIKNFLASALVSRISRNYEKAI